MDTRNQFPATPEVQFAVKVINVLHGLRKKLRRFDDGGSCERNVNALEQLFAEHWINPDWGVVSHDPTGEEYSETRDDCDAEIAGESIDDLVIVETNKPIIRLIDQREGAQSSIVVQKGAVVARSRNESEEDNG